MPLSRGEITLRSSGIENICATGRAITIVVARGDRRLPGDGNWPPVFPPGEARPCGARYRRLLETKFAKSSLSSGNKIGTRADCIVSERTFTRLVLLGDHGRAMPLQLSAELGDDGVQLGEPFLVPRRLLFRSLLGAGRLHLRSHQRGLDRLPRASSRHQPRVQLGHLGSQGGERGRVQL